MHPLFKTKSLKSVEHNFSLKVTWYFNKILSFPHPAHLFQIERKKSIIKNLKSKTFPNQNFSRNFSIILSLIYKYFSPKGILCCSRAFPLLYKRILYVLTLTPPISSLHFSISSGDIILYTLKNMFYLFPIQYIFVFLSYFM